MKRHRRHHRNNDIESNIPTNSTNSGVNDGIGSILKNFDISSIAKILSSIDINEVTALVNNLSKNTEQADSSGDNLRNIESEDINKKRSDVAASLQTLINADKGELLQIIMQLFAASKKTNKVT